MSWSLFRHIHCKPSCPCRTASFPSPPSAPNPRLTPESNSPVPPATNRSPDWPASPAADSRSYQFDARVAIPDAVAFQFVWQSTRIEYADVYLLHCAPPLTRVCASDGDRNCNVQTEVIVAALHSAVAPLALRLGKLGDSFRRPVNAGTSFRQAHILETVALAIR